MNCQLPVCPGPAVWGDPFVRGFDGSLSNYQGEPGEELDVSWGEREQKSLGSHGGGASPLAGPI